jgi:hypothetical protein
VLGKVADWINRWLGPIALLAWAFPTLKDWSKEVWGWVEPMSGWRLACLVVGLLFSGRHLFREWERRQARKQSLVQAAADMARNLPGEGRPLWTRANEYLAWLEKLADLRTGYRFDEGNPFVNLPKE